MRRALAIAVVLVAVAVPSASGLESTIYPGVGIGHIRLGVTKSQVERTLGRHHILNARQGAYTELAWDFATWTVGFERGRAVQISTTLSSQRTKERIGPGSRWLAVIRAYPGGRCTWNINHPQPTEEWPEYLIGRRGGTQTLWRFKVLTGVRPLRVPVVAEVTVRTLFRRLPEYAAGWGYRCADGWQSKAP